jgi:hypothetical protein
MQIESIKRLLNDPFKTFVVRTASGESHKVERPDAIAISPTGDLVILWPSEGGLTIVDVDQIAEVSCPGRRRR